MKTEPLHLDSVIIEITRRCNLRCHHCLRGDAQNLDISDDILKAFFRKVHKGYINTITFTGGEPSLAVYKIRKILSLLKKHKIELGNFYIATNAVIVPDDFIRVIIDLYLYCSDNESSAVNYSNDNYHDIDEKSEGIRKLSLLKIVSPKYEREIKEEFLIREGNAINNTCAQRELRIDGYLFDESDENYLQEGMFYLNCKGNVFSICDLSYESQEYQDLIVGNVFSLDFDFIAAAKEFNKRIEEKELTTVEKLRDKIESEQ